MFIIINLKAIFDFNETSEIFPCTRQLRMRNVDPEELRAAYVEKEQRDYYPVDNYPGYEEPNIVQPPPPPV